MSNTVKQPFRVIVAGGRDFNNYNLLKEKLDKILSNVLKDKDVTIISGHAHGADILGEKYAKEIGIKSELHPADWKNLGRKAGYIRNAEMADCADALVAFWDSESHGTADMIRVAQRKGLQVRIIRYTMKPKTTE